MMQWKLLPTFRILLFDDFFNIFICAIPPSLSQENCINIRKNKETELDILCGKIVGWQGEVSLFKKYFQKILSKILIKYST